MIGKGAILRDVTSVRQPSGSCAPTPKKSMKPLALIRASVLAAALASAVAPAAAQTPHTHHHAFSGAERWSDYFDDPKRDAWQKPHEVLTALAPRPDARIADIGSGTGYFTVRLARHVPEGRVYGVDVEPDMVKFLEDRARKAGATNVTSILGAPDDPDLPEKVDLVLMVDVYHHIANRGRYLRNLAASLKPGARVAIIDFNASSPIGPPPAERIGADRVKDEMTAAGYALAAEHAFLPNQYFLVFASARR